MNNKNIKIAVIVIFGLFMTSSLLMISGNNYKELPQMSLHKASPEASTSVNYNFSFLNDGNYNKNDIIVTNNSIWYYNTTSEKVCGQNLYNGNVYKFSTSGIINNEVQLYIPLNYIYFILANYSVYYINMNNFKINYYHSLINNSNSQNAYFLTNYGMLAYEVITPSSSTECLDFQFANFTMHKQNKITVSGGPPANCRVVDYQNWNINVNCNYGASSRDISDGISKIKYNNYGNMVNIGNNLYNENSTYYNASTMALTSGAQKINVSNLYSTKFIIPSTDNSMYGYLNLTDYYIGKNVKIKIKNPLLICSVDYNKFFYLNTDYHISLLINYYIKVKSQTTLGIFLSNNFILLNKHYSGNTSYINGTGLANFYLFPLNFSNYVYPNRYYSICQNNYTYKFNNQYYYNITLIYTSQNNVFFNPYKITNYVYPLSILLAFLFIGLIAYGFSRRLKE